MTAIIKDMIIERLSQGETLEAICRDSDMPSMQTVKGWAETDGDFSANYACAVFRYVEPMVNLRDCRAALLTVYGKPL